MVEPDLVDDDALRLDAEHGARTARWKPIATLQSPTARWPASSSARVTMPTGFVKSTIQAPSAARSRTRSAISSTTGTVRIAFAKPAGAGRLLPDAAAGERHGLVREARRLAADPDLEQHEVGAVDRAVEVAGELELAAEALPLEHPRGQAADDVAPLGVDVVQRRARDVEPSRSRESPETSSGVYVEPPPMTATFIPSPPSA